MSLATSGTKRSFGRTRRAKLWKRKNMDKLETVARAICEAEGFIWEFALPGRWHNSAQAAIAAADEWDREDNDGN
jgi:hypothetical protein